MELAALWRPIIEYLHFFSVAIDLISFLNMQATKTCIKYCMSSNFGQVGSLTAELAGLGV